MFENNGDDDDTIVSERSPTVLRPGWCVGWLVGWLVGCVRVCRQDKTPDASVPSVLVFLQIWGHFIYLCFFFLHGCSSSSLNYLLSPHNQSLPPSYKVVKWDCCSY